MSASIFSFILVQSPSHRKFGQKTKGETRRTGVISIKQFCFVAYNEISCFK